MNKKFTFAKASDENLPPNYDYLNDILDEPRKDRRFPDEEPEDEYDFISNEEL